MLEDRLLLWKLQRGDADALRRVYEKYRHDLLALAVTLSNDKAVAEDAVHDAFVSFVRFSPRLRLRASLRSYLLSAVANRVRSLNRSESRRATCSVNDSVEGPPPDHAAVQGERAMLVDQAMRELPYDQREAVITIRINTPQRQQEFVVDAQTKRPIRLTTIRDDNPMEMMRQTLAVKYLTEIRYNEQPPRGIFDKPADAVVVENEVDCMVDPDSGLAVDGMTREEACLAIVRQSGRALVDLNQATLCRLNLFYRLYPPQVWEQIGKLKETGRWVTEVAITGAPYQEGDLWYVPVEIQMGSGKSETQNMMIKFYELEGKTLCFIIGSKEKGVVD